jgi:hypothetical protein
MFSLPKIPNQIPSELKTASNLSSLQKPLKFASLFVSFVPLTSKQQSKYLIMSISHLFLITFNLCSKTANLIKTSIGCEMKNWRFEMSCDWFHFYSNICTEEEL